MQEEREQKALIAKLEAQVSSLQVSIKAAEEAVKVAEANYAAASANAPPASAPQAPVYVFGDITREEAESMGYDDIFSICLFICLCAGKLVGKDGAFFVRKRGPPGEYIMSLKYKERPTHHLIKLGEAGFLTVNNKQYGETKTIEEVGRTTVLTRLLVIASNPI